MPEHLSRRNKVLYGIGDTGLSLTATIIGAYFAIFLTDVVHLDLRVAAAAILVGRVWDWVNGPLIGPIPAVLLCGGIVFAILYPLGREQHANAVRELERRRAQRALRAQRAERTGEAE